MADAKAIKSLVDSLATSQDDTSLTDFALVCKGQKHNVHRLILAFHSPVLAKAVKGDFKEANERQIDLLDDEPLCVKALVCYFYTLRYTVPDTNDLDGPLTPGHHVKMCIIAHKYDIQPLKRLAVAAFMAAAKKDSAIRELADAAALAYEVAGATEEIRKNIIDLGIDRNLLSSSNPSLLGQVLVDFPELARDYAQAVEGQLATLKRAQAKVRDGEKCLQRDEALTDFVIVCADRKWNVHRVVLGLHSPVLAKAITGAFRESAVREMHLAEHDPDCVDALIDYAYKLEYPLPRIGVDRDNDDNLNSLSLHVKVCILADKYDIPHLKTIAIKNFEAEIDVVAVENLPAAAELAYDASPATEQIRKKIVTFGMDRKLLSTADDTGLAAMMVNIPGFTKDYAQALEIRLKQQNVAEDNNEKRYTCPSCRHSYVAYMPLQYGSSTFACYWCEQSITGDAWEKARVAVNKRESGAD
ncbi:hypothetical protein LTR85_001847 [Meristemomyces frigidus]|nr:hypothetical protein LTR85_001847 [Meristemomyces frigidus]